MNISFVWVTLLMTISISCAEQPSHQKPYRELAVDYDAQENSIRATELERYPNGSCCKTILTKYLATNECHSKAVIHIDITNDPLYQCYKRYLPHNDRWITTHIMKAHPLSLALLQEIIEEFEPTLHT
jgi:hypothetical protein